MAAAWIRNFGGFIASAALVSGALALAGGAHADSYMEIDFSGTSPAVDIDRLVFNGDFIYDLAATPGADGKFPVVSAELNLTGISSRTGLTDFMKTTDYTAAEGYAEYIGPETFDHNPAELEFVFSDPQFDDLSLALGELSDGYRFGSLPSTYEVGFLNLSFPGVPVNEPTLSFHTFSDDPPPIVTSGGVPEPITWALMLTGFGMVGAAARSRRPVRTAVNGA